MTNSLTESSPSTRGRTLAVVFESGFLPRFLGVLDDRRTRLAHLPLAAARLPGVHGVALVALVGSLAMIGWLLTRGVDDVKWRASAALAASSIWR